MGSRDPGLTSFELHGRIVLKGRVAVVGFVPALDEVEDGVRASRGLLGRAAKKGEKKILRECGLPLTGVRCVNRIITDYCVLDVTPRGLRLVELAPGVTAEQVQEMSEPRLIVEGTIGEIAA